MMELATPALFAQAELIPNAPAYASWSGSAWVPTTWATYAQEVRTASRGLARLGVQEGSRVAILSRNRREWLIAAHATFLLGGAIVGLYETSSSDELRQLLLHSEPRVAIVEDPVHREKIGMTVPHVVSLSEPSDGRILSWQGLIDKGAAPARGVEVPADPERLATIIYTSGTTGAPKGVMLSHRNVASAIRIYQAMTGVNEHDVLISYLPLAHIAEQLTAVFAPPLIGCSVSLCPRVEDFPNCIRSAQPTLFFGVPRVWEKFRDAVSAARAAGMVLTPALFLQMAGLGRVRLAASGSAPIDPSVLTFFHELGLRVYEGYGMTEASSPITQNTPEHNRVGTVGRVVPNMELRLAEDGEIIVSGPNVFMGYFKDAVATREALSPDGWLRTGDLGELDAEGFVTIIGRKKDLIITAGGKNIAPQKIELALGRHALLAGAVVIGDRRPFLVALLSLAPAASALEAQALRAQLDEHVAAVNATLARPEQIKKYAVLARPFSVDSGELTSTLKLRRASVIEHASSLIAQLYDCGEDGRADLAEALFGVSEKRSAEHG